MKWLCIVMMICLGVSTVLPCQETKAKLERIALARLVASDADQQSSHSPSELPLKDSTSTGRCHCALCNVCETAPASVVVAESLHREKPMDSEMPSISTPLFCAYFGSIWTPPKVA